MGTGQDKADNHRAYSSKTGYDMKEERRDMVTARPNKNTKRAKLHCSTKAQVARYREQLVT